MDNNVITIDLRNQWIGMWNIGEKVGRGLPLPKSEEIFILNLSSIRGVSRTFGHPTEVRERNRTKTWNF